MARHEENFRDAGAEELSLSELLALLGSGNGHEPRSREDIIACALSAGEGWQDAVKRLGGAFAEEERKLRERKDG